MVDSMNPLMVKMRDATNRNTDFELVREAMPALLVQMDGFIAASPDNTNLLCNAAEAYMGYAFLFVEDTDKKRAKNLYFKAKEYALRGLKQNKTFAEAFNQDDPEIFNHSLQSIEKEDIASLYFAITAWLQWIGASADDASVLNDLPRIEAMIDRAMQLDDTFYHGGVHATLGAFYVASPEMFGGKPEKADLQFKEAFEISESKYLVWHYLYARYYAFAVNDRDLFVTTLEKTISEPDDILPEEIFVNMAVKMKAKNLLSHVDDYFLSK
jgi:tetratricopeptide (TPR) repeat protein